MRYLSMSTSSMRSRSRKAHLVKEGYNSVFDAIFGDALTEHASISEELNKLLHEDFMRRNSRVSMRQIAIDIGLRARNYKKALASHLEQRTPRQTA